MSKALRGITADEIAAFEQNGFVKIAGVLPDAWVAELRGTIEALYERGIITPERVEQSVAASVAGGAVLLTDGQTAPTGRFCSSLDVWRQDERLKSLCLTGPLPGLAAQLFDTPKVNYLIDQMFVKEPGAARRTAFHSDESYFNCSGDQCATFWIPVDVVDKANGAMGYVPGSHLWGRKFKPNVFVSQMAIPGTEGEQIPDIEGDEAAFGVRYVESRPGDVIVHHYRTLHGSTGNTDPTRIRRAAALRYGGDDLRYLVRFPQAMTSASLREGDPMDSPEFPVVWPAGSPEA